MRVPSIATVAVSLALAVCPLTAAPRVWTDNEGRSVEAEFIRAEGETITIRRVGDGREFALPRARLSALDLAFVDATQTTTAAPPPWVVSLNEALNLPLFSDANLWDDAPSATAARLRLDPESTTPGAESWRGYLRPARPVLGVPAYMFALRTEDGKLAALTLMFTNRGDRPDTFGRAAPRISFEDEIARDFQRLRKALSDVLPGGEIEVSPARRNAQPGELALFEAGPHEFVLCAWPGQMVSLRIQPAARIAPPRLSDEQARQRLKAGVTRRPNGDVVLDRIPMVDQGPKGYCVPATFERMLRHAGIPADMYELAARGETGFGGGTSVPTLVEALEDTIRRAGRRLETIKIDAGPTDLARYVNEGRPVLWAMSSTAGFNQLADTYSTGRRALTTPEDLRAWAATRKKLGADLLPARGAAHVCLLIGYNRATGEIAFSDSWGPDFAERWLPAGAARQVSSGEGWVLDF